MAASGTAWPKKIGELQNHLMDSSRWNEFTFRDNDIVIGSWGKSGTTLTQQIVGQLIFNGVPAVIAFTLSPWLDLRIVPKEAVLAMLAAQAHRRIIKTHLPVDPLVFSPKAKYIYVGRDARDVVWSMYNHHINMTPEFYTVLNDAPGRVVPPLECPPADIRRYYYDWLEKDGFPFWPFWSHIQSWWNIRHLPNVLLLHFNNLRSDLTNELHTIARFLDIEINDSSLPLILHYCSMGYMRTWAAEKQVLQHIFGARGADAFFYKGTNGRWRDVLTPLEITWCDEIAAANLSTDCAHWLKSGIIRD